MIRLLLTLLALLTGLAAQSAVADPCAAGPAGAEVAAHLADSARPATVAERRVAVLVASPHLASLAQPRNFLFQPVIAAGVLAGIDRAHE